MGKKSKLGILGIGLMSVLLLILIVSVVSAQTTGTEETSQLTEYYAKYVCGLFPFTGEPSQEIVKPGNYATVINVHNFTPTGLQIQKRVSLSYREQTQPPPLVPPRTATIARGRTLAIDCPDIWLITGLPPGTFIEGYVQIITPHMVPVEAVYTSEAVDWINGGPPNPGAGISIDVETIEPFRTDPVP